MMNWGDPALGALEVSKSFAGVNALSGVSLEVHRGEVLCLLGDNGAGKSTLIKILSGVHQPDSGQLAVDGEPRHLRSPRDALDAGISTVFQDLAMIPLLPVARNFFLGREPTKGRGLLRRADWKTAREITRTELARVGIHLKDPRQVVGTLSGGERQSVAIARAIHFGASVLILDEPTSALGVKEAGMVLQLVDHARGRGLAVLFITHNVTHAYAIGDRFHVLAHGQTIGEHRREDVTREQLQDLMAGGSDMSELRRWMSDRSAGPRR